MLRAFNCGIGMVVVLAAEAADSVCATLRLAGEDPVLIGRIVAREADPVIFSGRLAL